MTPDDLRRRREALGLSLAGLAAQLGVDKATIYRWEHGKRKIPPYLAQAMDTIERTRGDIATFKRPKPDPKGPRKAQKRAEVEQW